MKSSQLSTNNELSWESPLFALAKGKKPSKTLVSLSEYGVKTLKELVWIFPLRIQKMPEIEPFNKIKPDELFLGHGKLLNFKLSPAFGRRGKGRVQLFNASVIVQDLKSPATIELRWFNIYPNFKKQIEAHDVFTFMGTPTTFKNQIQIVNPKINPKEISSSDQLLIEYPTVNKIAGRFIQGVINKIPNQLWSKSFKSMSEKFEDKLNLPSLNSSFACLHGKSSHINIESAHQRIIYEEFFINQLKVLARKNKNKQLRSSILSIPEDELTSYIKLFPYELTADQASVLKTIEQDFKNGHPMMRMIQGDVGCGKTTVAILAILINFYNKKQSAFMCPTEALALQHFETVKSILGTKINCEILLGSTKAKDKKIIYQKLESGEIDLIIGTHTLFQESVKFKDLSFAIIDEQHKFGVNQRIKLYKKGKAVHSLIMTATPIPRTLQLAQYGDLDISTIRTMPRGRKGIKTRIVEPTNYDKYLSFIKTRVELGEQVYIVVPAIEESEVMNIENIHSVLDEYKKVFPSIKIAPLHGQLKSEEKTETLERFTNGEIKILISTTVIEVGINIVNSTVISIYNPDRFGLSSLHQLRGRVGRGEKTGFCFLITNENISEEAMQRIKILEKSTDGFEISESDLANRGQGELFGSSQSGHTSEYRLANIFEHFDLFEQVSKDIQTLMQSETEKLNILLLDLGENSTVSATI